MKPISKDILPILIRRGVPERTAGAAMLASENQATEGTIGPEDMIILAGKAGVGKSVAACLWLAEKSKGKPECMRWIQSGDLARGYAYDRDSFEDLARVYALVIDDFGIEYLDEKGRYLVTLEELLSRRFGRMRKTLGTTNLASAQAFCDRYGPRINSRIHEAGAFVICGGPDLRRRAA
jgi:DNA replication protein DnaC